MAASHPEERVIILAPVGQDAPAMAAVLESRGISLAICGGAGEACCQISIGAGAVLITEEALELPQIPDLLGKFKAQPPWAELPLIILTKGGESRLAQLLDLAALAAGGVTLLERPLGAATLVRSVEVALRSRRRQYEVRDLLEEQRRKQQELEQAKVKAENEVAERKRAEEAKGRLAAIVESSQDAIVSKDLQGIITSWNRGAERLFGYTAQEAVGQSITLIIPSDRLQEEPRILERIRRKESIEHYETVRRRKNGTLVDISLTVSPIVDAHGTALGASKIARDISARKRAEALVTADLEATTRLYQVGAHSVKPGARFEEILGEIVEAAIAVSGADKGTLQLLDAASGALTLAAHRAFQEPFLKFFRTVRDQVSSCGAALRRGERILVEDVTSTSLFAGTPSLAVLLEAGVRSVQSTFLVSSAGQVLGMISTHYSQPHRFAERELRLLDLLARQAADFVERKMAEQTLREAQVKLQEHAADLEKTVAQRTKDLQATNEQLEAFVYSIAHDLRAPLRTLTGYSQLLIEDYGGHFDETAQHLLKRIQGASEFMDKLLLDLLAFGRTSRAQIELGPVEVRNAWEAARFQCSSQIEQTQAQVETIEPLPAVLAHEATLGQCLANLLSNALKFVGPGVRPQVRFRAEKRNGDVRLWMEDNGLGIAADEQERIFRVFERLHGGRYAGTGIGLSIVRKGVERMGGRVGLESAPERGSRFWIELPSPK